ATTPRCASARRGGSSTRCSASSATSTPSSRPPGSTTSPASSTTRAPSPASPRATTSGAARSAAGWPRRSPGGSSTRTRRRAWPGGSPTRPRRTPTGWARALPVRGTVGRGRPAASARSGPLPSPRRGRDPRSVGQPEAHVARGAVLGRAGARRDAVALAVRGVTEVRAALDYALDGPARGRAAGGPGRLRRRALGRRGAPPRQRPRVGGELPDVPDHAVEAEAVRLVGVDRRGAEVAVLAGVADGELALPDVAHVAAAGGELVAPGEGPLDEPAASRVLPLGLGGQPAAGPRGEGLGVAPRHVHDRVVEAVPHVRPWSLRRVPGRARHRAPPRRGGDGAGRRVVLRQQADEDERPAV